MFPSQALHFYLERRPVRLGDMHRPMQRIAIRRGLIRLIFPRVAR
jgi:hypothetical protein